MIYLIQKTGGKGKQIWDDDFWSAYNIALNAASM